MIKPFGILVVVIGMVLAGRGAMAITCEPGYYYESTTGACQICDVGRCCPGGSDLEKDSYYHGRYFCPEGYYAPNQGMSACLPVEPGYRAVQKTSFCDIANPKVIGACAILSESCPTPSQEPCPQGYYCPGATDAQKCPNGFTTSGTGGKSASECNVCSAGYGYYNGQCTLCPTGTYKSSSGATTCTNCTNKPANSSYVGTGATANNCKYTCNDGYYGATNATSGSCNACGNGYWCTGGVRNVCGANMTTATNKATSASACVCVDGYEMVDGVCVEVPKQTPCNAGVSVLHAGDYTYSLWTECDSPALWIGMDNGNCCVNLVPGIQNGALNIDYGGAVYHAVD